MVDARWLDEGEQQAWRAFLDATRLLLDQLDRELLRDAGMPHGYYEILATLSESSDRSMRMSELAARTRSSASRLSHAVARLEEREWIVREPSQTDKRGHVAHLTDAGFRALANAAPRHVAGVRAHLFDQLTPAQVVQLRQISEALLGRLTEHDPVARRGSAGP